MPLQAQGSCSRTRMRKSCGSRSDGTSRPRGARPRVRLRRTCVLHVRQPLPGMSTGPGMDQGQGQVWTGARAGLREGGGGAGGRAELQAAAVQHGQHAGEDHGATRSQVAAAAAGLGLLRQVLLQRLHGCQEPPARVPDRLHNVGLRADRVDRVYVVVQRAAPLQQQQQQVVSIPACSGGSSEQRAASTAGDHAPAAAEAIWAPGRGQGSRQLRQPSRHADGSGSMQMPACRWQRAPGVHTCDWARHAPHLRNHELELHWACHGQHRRSTAQHAAAGSITLQAHAHHSAATSRWHCRGNACRAVKLHSLPAAHTHDLQSFRHGRWGLGAGSTAGGGGVPAARARSPMPRSRQKLRAARLGCRCS